MASGPQGPMAPWLLDSLTSETTGCLSARRLQGRAQAFAGSRERALCFQTTSLGRFGHTQDQPWQQGESRWEILCAKGLDLDTWGRLELYPSKFGQWFAA